MENWGIYLSDLSVSHFQSTCKFVKSLSYMYGRLIWCRKEKIIADISKAAFEVSFRQKEFNLKWGSRSGEGAVHLNESKFDNYPTEGEYILTKKLCESERSQPNLCRLSCPKQARRARGDERRKQNGKKRAKAIFWASTNRTRRAGVFFS